MKFVDHVFMGIKLQYTSVRASLLLRLRSLRCLLFNLRSGQFHTNLIRRAAKQTILSSSQPWLQRRMLVSP